LGNLILLPPKLNSHLGSRLPIDKAAEYKRTGLFLAQQVVDSLSNWDEAAIESRENALLEWARREWAD
ncbi:MAG TPA: HNH endonuclease family protein, partial [Thermoanaerobaculia bacterium]